MSDYFQWDPDKYSIHVPAMDRDHEVLIGYMNELHSLHLARAPVEALSAALTNLVGFTKKHFTAEEALMLKIGFAGRLVHIGIHKQLLSQLDQFAQEFAAKGSLAEDFFVFLKMWLKAHICGVDIKYSESMRQGARAMRPASSLVSR